VSLYTWETNSKLKMELRLSEGTCGFSVVTVFTTKSNRWYYNFAVVSSLLGFESEQNLAD